MKALLINGSPRAKGCTYTALTELKETLEAEGIEVELPHFRLKMSRRSIAISAINSIGHFMDLSATSNNKGYRLCVNSWGRAKIKKTEVMRE